MAFYFYYVGHLDMDGCWVLGLRLGFTMDFSSEMLSGATAVELANQWASNDLISNLSEERFEAFGCLRRGLYVTILYKQTSTKLPGDFLGRLVLGLEGDQVKVFGATIF